MKPTTLSLFLADEAATLAWGRRLGEVVRQAAGKDEDQGGVIYLVGELGAGKTTWARGLLAGLGYTGRVKSPTYTLIEPYQVAGYTVLHLDLYRLVDAEEVEFLGLREALDTHALVLMEWPERGVGHVPSADVRVELEVVALGRQVRLQAASAVGVVWLARLGNEAPPVGNEF